MVNKFLPKHAIARLLIISLFFLTSIMSLGASDGCGGNANPDNAPSLTNVTDLTPGSDCAAGGYRIEVGYDLNFDNILGTTEVKQTKILCHGDTGKQGPAGKDGLAGKDGKDGLAGKDGKDGATGKEGLAGKDGKDGAAGKDGAISLLAVSDEPKGKNCEAGGKKVEAGLDNGDGAGTAGNGKLEAGEVDSTSYICHGLDGKHAPTPMFQMLDEPVGTVCPFGGKRINIGLDNGDNSETANDGVLGVGEIDSTTVVCNGVKGDKGDKGDQGDKGDKGDTGDKGDKGDTGDKGDKGDTGDKGDKGDKGDTGAAGAQGVQGDKGDKGDTGAQGIQGDTGAQGVQGAQGIQGDTGAQGVQGDKGDKGDTGTTGTPGTNGVAILINTSTIAPGGGCGGAGGIKIDIGLDNGDAGGTAGNGTLEAGEIDKTSNLCNGSL